MGAKRVHSSRRRRWGRVLPVGQVFVDGDAAQRPDAAAVHAERDALLADLARLPRRQQAVLSSPTGDITNPSMTEDAMREVAEAIEFVAPYSVTVPYRLDYLPAGMTPFNVVQDIDGDAPRSTIQLESADDAMDISIGEDLAGSDGWSWQDTSIAGHEARCADLIDGQRCEVEFGRSRSASAAAA